MSELPCTDTPDTPAPAPPVPVYRAALTDTRGVVIFIALAAWAAAHAVLGVLTANRLESFTIYGTPLPPRPDVPVWFSLPELQVGVRAFAFLGSSFLESAAWQVLGLALFIAGLAVVLTSRLRVIVTLFPPILFALAALMQCIAFSVHAPYWAQGNALFTLLFGAVATGVTLRLAPRNTTRRDLARMTRQLLRDAATNPAGLVFGPIFGKEVRVLGRHRGTYWVRAVYPLALLALVSTVYFASTSSINQFAAGAERIQRLQEIAPTLALFIAWSQFLILLFVAAALTSSAVCDERRTRTLASLMTTPMNATQIVMGKLTSRLVQILILGLISLPFMLGIRVFGGLEADVIIAFTAITISSTLLMASLGILASVWSRKPAAAAALAIMLFVLVTLGPALVVILAAMGGGGPPPMEIFAFSGPLAMVMTSVQVTGGGGAPVVVLRELWLANAVVNTALSAGAVFLAAVCLRGVMLSETALEAPKRKARRPSRRKAAASPTPEHPPAPDAEASETPAATEPAEVIIDRDSVVSDSPVLWRELRQPTLGTRRMLIIAACIAAALTLWLYSELPPWTEEPHQIVGVIGMILFCLQAAIVSTPTITNEKDASTWLTLLTTPLNARQILFPKFLGAVKKLWFIAALVFAELLIGFVFGNVHPVVFLHLLMIMLGVGFFLSGTGILFSLVARRTAGAGLFNMLLAGTLWIGLPIFGALASELLLPPSMRGSDWLVENTFYINPMVLTVSALEPSLDPDSTWNAHLANGSSYSMFSYTALLTVVCGVGAALGVAAVAFAAARFNRLAGRTS